MSMNLHLEANVDAFLSNGEKKIFSEKFELIQTPTKVTYAAINSGDPLKVYEEYISKLKCEDFNYKNHISEIEKWIDYHKKQGYRIEWYYM